jgi:hypothetical protein
MCLELNKSEVVITTVICPGGPECQHSTLGCLVQYFTHRFGLECNVGVAPPEAEMPIAWTFTGDTWDVDAAQVWVIPVADEAFSAWMITQQ